MNYHFLQPTNFQKLIKHILICVSILAGIIFLYYQYPVFYIYICAEDSWAEYASFIFYLLSGLLMACAIKKDKQLMRPGTILMCLGFFLVAMEEISWGQRIVGVRTPEIFVENNMQAEINIHNLNAFPKDNVFYTLAFLWAIILPILSKYVGWIKKIINKIGIPLISALQAPYFLCGLFLLFFYTVISDKEFGEMILSLSFTIFALDVYCKACVHKEEEPKRLKLSVVLALIVVLLTTVFVTLFPNFRDFRFRLNEYAEIKYPKRGLTEQTLKVYQYIAERKEMRKSRTLLNYGRFLKSISSPELNTVLQQAILEQVDRQGQQPKNPEPNYVMGNIYKLMDSDRSAQKQFQLALQKIDEKLNETDNNLKISKLLKAKGEVYLAMDDKQSAIKILESALKRSEKASIANRIKELIESIREN